MKKDNKKKRIKIAIIVCIVLILILLLLIAILSNNKDNNQAPAKVITKEEKEDRAIDNVRALSEKTRIQVYLAEFLEYIEDGKFSKAYERLYPEFKNNFFETEKEFIKYAKKHYGTLMTVEYEDIQRQGNIYILSVKITTLDERQMETEAKYVIQENGLNDYYVSFQVDF